MRREQLPRWVGGGSGYKTLFGRGTYTSLEWVLAFYPHVWLLAESWYTRSVVRLVSPVGHLA